jgi:hypothetical protein
MLLVTLGGMPHAAQGALLMPRQNLATYAPAQWEKAFALAAALPQAQRIAFWADLAAVGSRYVADPLGEGAGQTPDPQPLCDYTHVDCMTFIEQVYALSLSATVTDVADRQRCIRYRDGIVAYRWRNHYLVSDWLPANAWFIRDVTDEIGADTLTPMRKTIARAAFFAGKGLPEYGDVPDEQATTRYIPRKKMSQVLCALHTGDLVIFVIDTPGIIAGHTGLLRVEHGVVYVQHASQTAGVVVTLPLTDYLRTAPARFVGCKIARPFLPTPAPPQNTLPG